MTEQKAMTAIQSLVDSCGTAKAFFSSIIAPKEYVKLSSEHWEKAREIGNGNMAQGIRLALDSYRREDK